MDTQATFWVLMLVTAVELIAIYVMVKAISAIVQSEVFKAKLERKWSLIKTSKISKETKTLIILPFLFSATWSSWALSPEAAAVADSQSFLSSINQQSLYFIALLDLILLAIIWYLKGLLQQFVNIDKTKEELAAEKAAKKPAVSVTQLLTDAVPIEEEFKVETDHEYDGIRELDNNLPPWWKWGFYLSIVSGIIYMSVYHVFKTGDLQTEEYLKEMAFENEKVQAYLESQALNVDENSVVLLADASDINSGKDLYMTYCKVCHGGGGEGTVGPNLADEYWLYGGNIKSVFKTIKYGAERGMKSWKDELNPVQMQQVASFVLSLQGTNPPNPKAAEGKKDNE
ncbi:MAG: cbb3-type cytochrome c oxidase N-terminal domain-containing protein [Flavobacteriales bacterium]